MKKLYNMMYNLAKKCENPNNKFYSFLNYFFNIFMILYGKFVYSKICSKNPNKQIILCPGKSNGDAYLLIDFLNEIYDAYNIGKKDVIIVCESNIKKLFEDFGFKNIYPISLLKITSLSMTYHFYGRNKINIIYSLFWVWFEHNDKNIIFEYPKYDTMEAEINNFFNEINCRTGRTLILSPYEKTMKVRGLNKPPNYFWEKIIDLCHKKDIDVVMNCKGDCEEPLIGDCKKIFPRFRQCHRIAEKAGFVVATRSGFCDFIRNSNARMWMLYPNSKFFEQNKMEITARKDNKIIEIIYKENEEYWINLANEIVEEIENELNI